MYSLARNILPKLLKNLLIIFPLLISNIQINKIIYFNLFSGFVIFSIITTIIYITNDYVDYKNDKLNILKKNKVKNYFSKSKIIIINLSLIPLIFASILIEIFSVYLILYIISFYIYTLKTKYIKFLDLIFLNSFYLFRVLFGCDLINVEISYWLIIFFSSLFLILSIFKRIIQIKINNLKKPNQIISYSLQDYIYLKKIIIVAILINCSIFLIYIFQNDLNYLQFFSSESTFVDFNKNEYFIIYFIYVVNLIILTTKVFKKRINKDIFYFVINDKLIILSLIITVSILVFR